MSGATHGTGDGGAIAALHCHRQPLEEELGGFVLSSRTPRIIIHPLSFLGLIVVS